MDRAKEWIRLKGLWEVIASLEKSRDRIARLSHLKWASLELSSIITDLTHEANELKQKLDETFELK